MAPETKIKTHTDFRIAIFATLAMIPVSVLLVVAGLSTAKSPQEFFVVLSLPCLFLPIPLFLWIFLGIREIGARFESIRNLRSVNYQPARQPSDPLYYEWGTMGRVEFVLQDTYSTGGRYGGYKRVQVGVPHGREAEAIAIMNRFVNERLQGQNG